MPERRQSLMLQVGTVAFVGNLTLLRFQLRLKTDCGFDTDWASLRTYDEPFELSDRCVTRPVSRADNNSRMFLREVRRCGSGLLLAASFIRDIKTCQSGKCFFLLLLHVQCG